MSEKKPSENSKRNWSRVSLKTLLALITLLAILFAVISSGPIRQRWAVAELRLLGAEVTYAMSAEELSQSWLAEYVGTDFVSKVRRVELVVDSNADFPDAGFPNVSALKYLSGLEQLKIGGALDADAFAAIGRCLTIKEITFSFASFDGALLERLQRLDQLHMLVMHNSLQVSDGAGEFDFQGRNAPRDFFKTYPLAEYRAWRAEILPGIEVHEELETNSYDGCGFGGSGGGTTVTGAGGIFGGDR